MEIGIFVIAFRPIWIKTAEIEKFTQSVGLPPEYLGGANYNRLKTSKTWSVQAKALGSRCLPIFRFLPQVIRIYFV